MTINILCMTDNQQLSISAIIPAYNSERFLPEVLERLKNCSLSPLEIIVVDDGSTDKTLEIARSFGVTALAISPSGNANRGRNTGGFQARGDILLFLDSDVLIGEEMLPILQKAFSDKHVSAVVGVYSATHRNPNLASQYKNLWIRYSYLISNPSADWIFGAVCAMRRDVFETLGGFDAMISMKYGGEDLEFGKRITKNGYHILLLPELEVEHLKRHTVGSLIRNQFERSQGFTALALRLGEAVRSPLRGFANVYPRFILSTVLALPILLTLALFAGNYLSILPFFVLFTLYLFLNIPFLAFIHTQRGLITMLGVLGIVYLDNVVCSLGIMRGIIRWIRTK